MNQPILQSAETRYASKSYDPSRPLTAAQVAEIKELLRLAPSSINIQPWRFILAGTPEGKARVAKAAHDNHAYNRNSIERASHVVVFAAKTDVDDDYVNQIVAQEEIDGRYLAPANKEQRLATMLYYTAMHRDEKKDAAAWMANQVYINLGAFLLGVAAMGLDATPMEGVDMAMLDAEFDLPAKGYTTQFVVTVGHHAEDDFNAKLPKSRLTLDAILEEI